MCVHFDFREKNIMPPPVTNEINFDSSAYLGELTPQTLMGYPNVHGKIGSKRKAIEAGGTTGTFQCPVVL